jgi:ferredoxin-NADP reductase
MAGTALYGRLTWQTAAVTSVTRETSSVCTIGLDLPDWPGHRAGQHVDVRLTAEDGYTAEREYSIASAPGEPLAIMVERWWGWRPPRPGSNTSPKEKDEHPDWRQRLPARTVGDHLIPQGF